MGKAAVVVVFVVCFIVFIIAKTIFVGTKAAYEAVFDPANLDHKAHALMAECFQRIDVVMREKYSDAPADLDSVITHLTLLVQTMCFDKGIKVDSVWARKLAGEAIVLQGHATRHEVACA